MGACTGRFSGAPRAGTAGRAMTPVCLAGWDPDFLERSPMFAPLRVHAARLRTPHWPTLDDLQRALAERRPPVVARSGAPISFVPQERRAGLFEDRYEPRIYLEGEVQVRERGPVRSEERRVGKEGRPSCAPHRTTY